MGNNVGFGVWTAAAVGAGCALGAQQVWQVAQVTGGFAPVCSTALAVAALSVLAAWRMRTRNPFSRAQPKRYVEFWERAWDPALSPEEWLRNGKILAVTDEGLEASIRTQLVLKFRPLSWVEGTDAELDLPKPLMLLAVALGIKASEANLGRRLDCREILDGLDCAMAEPTCDKREAAVAALDAADKPVPLTCGFPGINCRKVLAGHGTRETFFMGLLSLARQVDGPLATGEFAWLKAYDRDLWYALNNLGRSVYHVEGLAAMDHYLHETAAGHAVTRPYVEGAVAFLASFRRNPLLCEQPATAMAA